MKDIIITGPKHSGKTNAGKAAASMYSLEFIDLDELIFQKTGKSPRELFNISQDIFRKAETEAVSVLFAANEKNQWRIIAAGGGIIDNPEAAAIIKKADAITVYLNISADCAWDRIEKEDLPPFLKTENPKETHRALHEHRAAAYARLADIIIKAEGKNPLEIAAEIMEILSS